MLSTSCPFGAISRAPKRRTPISYISPQNLSTFHPIYHDIPLEKIQSWIYEYSEVGELYKNIDLLDVTDTQRKKLHMLFEFSKRAKYIGKEKVTLDSSSKTGSYFLDMLSMKQVEEFVMVALNAQNQVIKTVTLFTGTVNETAVHAREVARRALET